MERTHHQHSQTHYPEGLYSICLENSMIEVVLRVPVPPSLSLPAGQVKPPCRRPGFSLPALKVFLHAGGVGGFSLPGLRNPPGGLTFLEDSAPGLSSCDAALRSSPVNTRTPSLSLPPPPPKRLYHPCQWLQTIFGHRGRWPWSLSLILTALLLPRLDSHYHVEALTNLCPSVLFRGSLGLRPSYHKE